MLVHVASYIHLLLDQMYMHTEFYPFQGVKIQSGPERLGKSHTKMGRLQEGTYTSDII